MKTTHEMQAFRGTSAGAERRLKLWLRLWAPAFAIGGAMFYLTPKRVTESMNQQVHMTGLEESPVDADNLWVVLAAAYMALITGLSQTAAADPVKRQDLVRFLILGKAASSLGSLGYFMFRRRAHAFLVNFVVDGAICLGTYALLQAALPQEERS